MVLGFFKVEFESRVLSYDDEDTPLRLCGKKMLPILEINKNGEEFLSNESLVISKKLDDHGKLYENVSDDDLENVNKLVSEIGKKLHPLAMPAWLNTPEFNHSAKKYFVRKKEKSKGPFSELIKKSELLRRDLSDYLCEFDFPELLFIDE